jgi:protein-S-isoprenylcysteine O-methyltransferase Ste14
MSLKSKLMVQCVLSLCIAALLLFLPAGTLHFWEAWIFLGIFLIPMMLFAAYYYKHDPALLQRRMESRENVKEQRVLMRLATLVFAVGMIVPGLDHRFGWTNRVTNGVPLWVEISAQALALAGYLASMWVVNVNRFAARTIRVEQGQQVISLGPYRLVRHPMYSAMLLMWLAVSPALGSYLALPIFALFIPVFVFRLLNEEKVLQRELPGYEEYCQKTRFRLVPHVW